MIRKISGKNKSPTYTHLNMVGTDSKDLQIPKISMTSKYLELKPVEQLNFRSVSHGDLMFQKSIIKHLVKRFWI